MIHTHIQHKHTKKGEFYSLMQLNDPLVFLHKSSAMQLCVPVVHSSTSENGENNNQAPSQFS